MRAPVRRPGLPHAAQGARHVPGNHARLLGQQQGRRLSCGELRALRSAGAAGGSLQRRGRRTCASSTAAAAPSDAAAAARIARSSRNRRAVSTAASASPSRARSSPSATACRRSLTGTWSRSWARRCWPRARRRRSTPCGANGARRWSGWRSARSRCTARSCTTIRNSGAFIRRRRRSNTSAACRSHRGPLRARNVRRAGHAARDPVGVCVGAEPLCPAGVVRSRQRAGGVCGRRAGEARAADRDVSRVAVLSDGRQQRAARAPARAPADSGVVCGARAAGRARHPHPPADRAGARAHARVGPARDARIPSC